MRQHSVPHKESVTVVAMRPTADQYLHLREHAGFDAVGKHATEAALAGALFSVCAMHDNQVVGCGRIVGDGGLYFYIEDIIVEEAYRGQGIGGRILQALLAWLRTRVQEGASVRLMAAGDAPGFFRHYGFEPLSEGQSAMSLPEEVLQAGTLS